MEELVWTIKVFGLEIGRTKYKLHNFYYDPTYNLLYIGHLRFYKKLIIKNIIKEKE